MADFSADWELSEEIIDRLDVHITVYRLPKMLTSPPVSSCLPARRGGGFPQHDQERPRGARGRRDHGLHHGAGAGSIRLQAPDPQALAPAHVTAGSPRWESTPAMEMMAVLENGAA